MDRPVTAGAIAGDNPDPEGKYDKSDCSIFFPLGKRPIKTAKG